MLFTVLKAVFAQTIPTMVSAAAEAMMSELEASPPHAQTENANALASATVALLRVAPRISELASPERKAELENELRGMADTFDENSADLREMMARAAAAASRDPDDKETSE